MTTLAPATAGVVRLQAVYTPAGERGHGYAGALVAALSDQVLKQGDLPALYTDLGNPTSNSVYRRIGYQCVAEVTRYRFG
jgi:predicted GNAT family acetyltransferase